MVPHASVISESEVSIMALCQLCSSCYTTVRIKICPKGTSAIKVATMKNLDGALRPSYCLETEGSITLLCQLCAMCYTAVWIKNCLKSTSVIKAAIMKNMNDLLYVMQWKPLRAITISTLSLSTKTNGTQRRTLISPWRRHCMYCSMPKGTSWAEALSNSEKNQACSLSRYRVTLVWRHQAGGQAVS